MTPEPASLLRKTRLFTALVILTNVSGNFSLSRGLRGVSGLIGFSLAAYLPVFANPWVITGMVLLTFWLLSQLSLLSWADLSYVLPVTAIAYVLTALLGRLVSDEPVTATRWMGILLITSGAILVGRTTAASSDLRSIGKPE